MAYRPAWVGKDGYPLSWRHYQYGLAHIARENLRQGLAMSQAVRMAHADKDDWLSHQSDITLVTEVPRHG